MRDLSADADIVYLAGEFDEPRVGALGSDLNTGSSTDWNPALSADDDTNTILAAPRASTSAAPSGCCSTTDRADRLRGIQR